jgi:excisionase family DNA binding protein
MNHRLLTLQQTAAFLQVPYPRAASLARLGLIPAIRLGRQVRIDPTQLQRFLAEGGAGSLPKPVGSDPVAVINRIGSAVAPAHVRRHPSMLATGRRLY